MAICSPATRAAAPLPGEDLALRDESRRLSHVETLQRAAGLAHDVLSGTTGAGIEALDEASAGRSCKAAADDHRAAASPLPDGRQRQHCE